MKAFLASSLLGFSQLIGKSSATAGIFAGGGMDSIRHLMWTWRMAVHSYWSSRNRAQQLARATSRRETRYAAHHIGAQSGSFLETGIAKEEKDVVGNQELHVQTCTMGSGVVLLKHRSLDSQK
jgi:hypothetical protein